MDHTELYAKYPDMFSRRHLDATRSCMHWGISCGDGWNGIIDSMCAELSEKYPDTKFEQIKQKFGRLVVYLWKPDDAVKEDVYRIVDAHCVMARCVCERCGAPGEIRQKSWIEVLCDHCLNHRK